MRMVAVAFAAGMSATAALAEEGFDPGFVADGVVEMLRAHGFDTSLRNGASLLPDGTFEVTGIVAEGDAAFLSVERLTLREIADEEGEKAWFRLGGLVAEGVDVRWQGYGFRADRVSFGDLRLLNLNEADAQSEFSNIDGAFSALRFATASVEGFDASRLGTSLVTGTRLEAKAEGWWSEPSFPTAVTLEVSGKVHQAAVPGLPGVDGADFSARFRATVDTGIRIGSAEAAVAVGNGEAAASLGLEGLSVPAAKGAARWLLGSGELAPEVTVTRFAAAGRGLGWASWLPDAVAGMFPQGSEAAAVAAAKAVASDVTSVLKAVPPVPVPLSEAAGTIPVSPSVWGIR